MNTTGLTLADTIVYEITCIRDFDQKCVMKKNIRALNSIRIDDFAKYWIGSFGEEVLEKSKSENGNKCSIVITSSDGQYKMYSAGQDESKNNDEKPVELTAEDKPVEPIKDEPVADEHVASEKIDEVKADDKKDEKKTKSVKKSSKLDSEPKDKAKSKKSAKPADK
jgi:hypothetical protein